jgi:hypothetical protein
MSPVRSVTYVSSRTSKTCKQALRSKPHRFPLRYIFVLFRVDKNFDNLAIGVLLRPQRGVAINMVVATLLWRMSFC